MELRDYQRIAANLSADAYEKGIRNQLIELPTGTGKTVTMAEITWYNLTRGKVLFLAHRQEIIDQTVALFSNYGLPIPGVVMNTQDEYTSPIVCASIQTLYNVTRQDRIFNDDPPVTLLIDECHHVTKDSAYADIIKRMPPNSLIIGVSATPFRSDGGDLTEFFQPVFVRSIPQMQEAGWLTPTKWYQIMIEDMDLKDIKVRIQNGERDFKQSELSAAMLPHAEEMTDKYMPLIGDRTALIFAVSLAHMEALRIAAELRGLKIAAVWGDMPKQQRADTLTKWKSGEIQAVVNVGVLTEGYDFPGIRALVMARPTHSAGFYTQMLGRGLRVIDGKADCVIVDFTGRPEGDDAIELPDITGQIEDTENSFNSVPQIREYRLRMFKKWSPVSFVKFPGNVFIISTGNGTAYGIAQDNSTGLWLMIAIDTRAIVEVSELSEPIYTQRQATEKLSITLEEIGIAKTLWKSNSSWRRQDPSYAQLNYLSRKVPSVYRSAIMETWNRGQVSDALTYFNYKNPIRRWVRKNANT